MTHCMLTSLIDEYVITYTHLSGVQRFDTQDHVLPKIQSQFSNINLSFVSQQPTASHVIEDVMWQLSFEETKLDGEAGFGDVAGSYIDSSGLSYDESFGFDDLDLNLNEHVGLNVYQTKKQSTVPVFEVPVYEEPDGNGQENESAHSDGQLFYDVEGIYSTYETQYDVQSSEDARTDDDDDFMVDEENEIVKPDVDVHLFGISMDVPFENIGATNLVLDDVLEKEDVDVINLDGFDSDPSNDNETSNYMRSRLAELSREMEGVMNGSGQWKYSFYTGQNFSTAKEAKDRVYLHSIESTRNLKLYKNDSVRVRARCDGKVYVSIMSQGNNDDSQASSSVLDAQYKGDLCPWVLYLIKLGLIQISQLRQFKTSSNVTWRFRYQGMKVGPNGSSGPTIRIKKERKEAKDRVYLHSIESTRNLKLYKNDSVRVRARCDGKVLKTEEDRETMMSQSSSSSVLDAQYKGDLCPWVLVNPDIPVKAVQDQLQRDLEV
ncbi:hypothetical protein Tco_0871407 [Tanacetum coccineum]